MIPPGDFQPKQENNKDALKFENRQNRCRFRALIVNESFLQQDKVCFVSQCSLIFELWLFTYYLMGKNASLKILKIGN